MENIVELIGQFGAMGVLIWLFATKMQELVLRMEKLTAVIMLSQPPEVQKQIESLYQGSD